MQASTELDYWANDLERIGVCPACGAADHVLKYGGLRDFLERVPGEWEVQRCRGCSGLFLDPRPGREAIGKAYRTYYTHRPALSDEPGDNGTSLLWRWANGYLNERFRLQREPASTFGNKIISLLFPLRQQLDFYMRHLPADPGRLLDVGCGNGKFLLRASAAGWEAIGLEPDPAAVRAATLAGAAVQCGTLETFRLNEAPRFDYITASNVIEHVPSPGQFAQGIYQLLKPGGVAWLATPNVASLGHWWYRRAWRGLEPPRHMMLFGRRALRQLLAGAGFVDIRFHCRGRGSAYILAASAEIAGQYRMRRPPLPSVVVDMLASVCSGWGEEIVVTARRPL